MKAKTTSKSPKARTERGFARSVQRVVGVPRGYKRVAAQMDAIASQFKHGASMTRLSHKHSLPLSTIEFVIRMKMLGHANEKALRPRTPWLPSGQDVTE